MQGTSEDFTRDPLLRAYASLLRAYRERADLSRPQLAAVLGCTHQWIEAVESGRKPPSEAFSQDLDTYFETPVGDFHRMWIEIKRAGKHLALPPGFPAYLHYEERASSIRKYQALLIDGLFQAEPYARSVLKSGQKVDVLEQLVAARLGRQDILSRDEPPRVWAIIDGWVLRRGIGDVEVIREQVRQLRAFAEHPYFTLQVVPESAGGHPGLGGSFTILSFDDGSPDVAYIEGAGGHGLLLKKPTEVADLAVRFDLIRAAAMPDYESLRLITALLENR